jgi:hypothetical protein
MKKVVFAASQKVEEYREETNALLFAIAKYMIEDGEDPEDWVACTFVSNESSLGDFLCSEQDLVSLVKDLQMPTLRMRDLLCDIAAIMRQKLRTN